MPNSPRYTGYLSGPYTAQLTDDTGAPINLTGVDVQTGFTFIMQNTSTLAFQYGLGAWTITDAANGKVEYQWTTGDLASAGTFLVYITVQLPGEPYPRAFDPDTIVVKFLQKGNAAIVSTQDVNLIEVNGAQVSSANPVPVAGPMTTADGGNVAMGSRGDAAITDPTVSATEIALLKGLVKILTLQGVVVTAESGEFVDGAIATLGSEGDAAWSGSGNGTAIAILKKLEALLAATQTITGNVTEANSSSINTHVANIDADSASIVANTANIETHAVSIDTTASAIKSDTDTIATNTTGLATQATLASAKTDLDSIATNTSNTATNTSNIETHAASIDTNTGNIETHAANIDTATAGAKTDLDSILTHNANIDTATAASKTDLDTIATNTGRIPSSPAQEGGNLATLIPGVQGWIAATGNGTSGQDNALTFAQQVRKIALYNASANNVPLEFDQTSTAASFPIPPGAFWIIDGALCTNVHVFPSTTLAINTTNGLYVKGWK